MQVVEIVHASASCAPSDDAAGFRHAQGALHLWVIDGATSVSAVPNKADPAMSDAAWFARALSAAIHRSVTRAPLTLARLADLLRRIEARYRARVPGPLAPHDWPVAALSYAVIRPQGRRFRTMAPRYCTVRSGISVLLGHSEPSPGRAPAMAHGPAFEQISRREGTVPEVTGFFVVSMDPLSQMSGPPVNQGRFNA